MRRWRSMRRTRGSRPMSGPKLTQSFPLSMRPSETGITWEAPPRRLTSADSAGESEPTDARSFSPTPGAGTASTYPGQTGSVWATQVPPVRLRTIRYSANDSVTRPEPRSLSQTERPEPRPARRTRYETSLSIVKRLVSWARSPSQEDSAGTPPPRYVFQGRGREGCTRERIRTCLAHLAPPLPKNNLTIPNVW